jgi:hypothetical protein
MLNRASVQCGLESKFMGLQKKKPDFQTLSLFLTLAILTGFFLFGLKWILLTPDSRTPATIESK